MLFGFSFEGASHASVSLLDPELYNCCAGMLEQHGWSTPSKLSLKSLPLVAGVGLMQKDRALQADLLGLSRCDDLCTSSRLHPASSCMQSSGVSRFSALARKDVAGAAERVKAHSSAAVTQAEAGLARGLFNAPLFRP